ncbi:hypothetical protein QKU48_gp1286 [Fadolivirus algeromassiliense]|jgi:hypothetical protein|uniref:Uncharacterized protein n=1 Tax=Fadolivirus FV1/VV64 TaxID=3070911 RepID=A0A7D3QVZ4_9VIRU|nr:hypothetical protein QKU48_gp1286 [Fadolivirus algeromassiliense]QKF94744.1 hypothetical protein Fadolivirus_1_1286 [Fadolivirus FV1/VV64]
MDQNNNEQLHAEPDQFNDDPQLQTELERIRQEVQKSLPDGAKLQYTEQFIDSVKKSMNKPHKTFEDQIKEVCNENIINATFETDTTCGKMIKMSVTLDKANYGNYLYYRIVCDCPCKGPFDVHPFMRVVDKNHHDFSEMGEVVADNPMVRKMFEFLVMPDDELVKHSGNTSAIGYRACIISCIEQLWD